MEAFGLSWPSLSLLYTHTRAHTPSWKKSLISAAGEKAENICTYSLHVAPDNLPDALSIYPSPFCLSQPFSHTPHISGP
jgi:hypothetical protein